MSEEMQPPSHDERAGATRLLRRIRDNDSGALAELLGAYGAQIERWVRKERGQVVGSRFETMDCVQDVTLDLVRYLPNVKIADSQAFRALLYRMIQNSLRNKYDYLTARRRSLAREQPIGTDTVLDLDPPDPRASTPSSLVAKEERRAWIRLGLALLDGEDQEVVLRHQFEGESFTDMSRSLGSTPDAVRMRFNRALIKLNTVVGKLRRGKARELADDLGAEAKDLEDEE
jgi:RNA polymerase sigma factor (sigma-70 family)